MWKICIVIVDFNKNRKDKKQVEATPNAVTQSHCCASLLLATADLLACEGACPFSSPWLRVAANACHTRRRPSRSLGAASWTSLLNFIFPTLPRDLWKQETEKGEFCLLFFFLLCQITEKKKGFLRTYRHFIEAVSKMVRPLKATLKSWHFSGVSTSQCSWRCAKDRRRHPGFLPEECQERKPGVIPTFSVGTQQRPGLWKPWKIFVWPRDVVLWNVYMSSFYRSTGGLPACKGDITQAWRPTLKSQKPKDDGRRNTRLKSTKAT